MTLSRRPRLTDDAWNKLVERVRVYGIPGGLDEEGPAIIAADKELSRLRDYIKHFETCSVCNEGLMGMCGERDELRRLEGDAA